MCLRLTAESRKSSIPGHCVQVALYREQPHLLVTQCLDVMISVLPACSPTAGARPVLDIGIRCPCLGSRKPRVLPGQAETA